MPAINPSGRVRRPYSGGVGTSDRTTGGTPLSDIQERIAREQIAKGTASLGTMESTARYDLENYNAPGTPSEDEYIDYFNSLLPKAGANIQRQLMADALALGKNRDAAAQEVARAPEAFNNSYAASQANLQSGIAAGQAALSPDAQVGADTTAPLTQNLAKNRAASADALPVYGLAIEEAYNEKQKQLMEAGGTAMDAANSDRAFQLLQLALGATQQDREMAMSERERLQARADRLGELRYAEQADERAAKREEEQYQDRLVGEQLLGMGYEGGANVAERDRESAGYRYAVQQLSDPNTVTSAAGHPLGQGPGAVDVLPGEPKGTFNAFNRDTYLKSLQKSNPQRLALLAADGYLNEDELAKYLKITPS